MYTAQVPPLYAKWLVPHGVILAIDSRSVCFSFQFVPFLHPTHACLLCPLAPGVHAPPLHAVGGASNTWRQRTVPGGHTPILQSIGTGTAFVFRHNRQVLAHAGEPASPLFQAGLVQSFMTTVGIALFYFALFW